MVPTGKGTAIPADSPSASHPRTERRGRHLNRHSWQKKSAAECAVFLFTGGVQNSQKANITPGRTLGKCHLAIGASQEKTPRARGALRGRGRALACPSTPTHVPVFLKSRVRSVFLHKTSLKAAWRLLQLCIAALAGRCLALGGLQPRTNSGALTRMRRRRSSSALCSYLRVASTITQRLTPHQEKR